MKHLSPLFASFVVIRFRCVRNLGLRSGAAFWLLPPASDLEEIRKLIVLNLLRLSECVDHVRSCNDCFTGHDSQTELYIALIFNNSVRDLY